VKEVDVQEPTEFAWRINGYLTAYIQFCDAKAGAVVALVALVAGAYAAGWPASLAGAVPLAGIALLALPCVFALLIVLPRLSGSTDRGVIFWEDIAGFGDHEAYAAALRDANEFGAVTRQNYTLAHIARRKYRLLRRSVFLLFLALLYVTVSYLVTTVSR
jgi:hypothetical protein